MFIVSFKPKKRKSVVIFALIFIIFAAVIFSNSHASIYTSDAIIGSDGISNNEQRIFYLESLGLTVSAEPIEMAEVIIPDKFDDVYTRYNEIQKEAGFDLLHHRGESCIRYTYNVYNFEEEESPVYANILVIEDHVIGGDISSAQLDGFMLPLNYMKNNID